jgi:dTDP-4-amino-4,6-dideoxygalactose transaminase
MINVVKPNLPGLEEYVAYLHKIWDTVFLTNNGPLVTELENQLKQYLDVKYLRIVSSGTIALQIAIKCLELEGEVITTPFSHVSTLNSILWQNCTPVFVDIEPHSYCIDSSKIEAAISGKTCAIIATHVYGFPCQVEHIQKIAGKHGLKVIYDGAHAFGVKLNNQSIFNYGDMSIVSFHATKVFHCIEGGAIISNCEKTDQQCSEMRSFGFQDPSRFIVGINGKNSELHAAMGLCNLPKVNMLIEKRRDIYNLYKIILNDLPLQYPNPIDEIEYNFSYFPVIFPSEEKVISIIDVLNKVGVYPRRYFHPSLNKLYNETVNNCPVAEDISKRVLCLPLYYDLSLEDAEKIARLIVQKYDG